MLDDHHPGGYTREVLGAARTLYVRTNIGDCTITNASPAIVTIAAHGLHNHDQVAFFTTGGLPTGLTAGTAYYVSGKTTNTFRVSATAGGAEINTSSAGSGTHSVATGNDSNDGLTTGQLGALFTPRPPPTSSSASTSTATPAPSNSPNPNTSPASPCIAALSAAMSHSSETPLPHQTYSSQSPADPSSSTAPPSSLH